MKSSKPCFIAFFLVGIIIYSCKKSPNYDPVPTSILNISVMFNPQYPIPTLNTTYADTSTTGTGNISKSFYNAFCINTFATAAYQPVGLEYKVVFRVSIPITLATNPKLEPTSYSLGETPFAQSGFYTLLTYNDTGTGYEYGWGLYGNGDNFHPATPLGTTATITNIYTKYLSDGKTHTYADGSFTASYYGGEIINVSNVRNAAIGYAQIVGSFKAMEVFE
jgi:hypothetical protein